MFCIATYAATVFQCAGLAQQQCSTQPSDTWGVWGKQTHVPGCDTCSTRSALARSGVKKKASFQSSWMKCWTDASFSHVKSALYKSHCVFRAYFYYLKHLHLLLLGLKPCAWSHTLDLHPVWTKKKSQGLFVTSQDFYQSGVTLNKESKCFENVSSPKTNGKGAYRRAVEQKRLPFGSSACTFSTILALLFYPSTQSLVIITKESVVVIIEMINFLKVSETDNAMV